MSKREDFKKFYETAAELGIQRSLAAVFIPSADELLPGQDVLVVAFGRMAKAHPSISPFLSSGSVQSRSGRNGHGGSDAARVAARDQWLRTQPEGVRAAALAKAEQRRSRQYSGPTA